MRNLRLVKKPKLPDDVTKVSCEGHPSYFAVYEYCYSGYTGKKQGKEKHRDLWKNGKKEGVLKITRFE